MKKIFLISISGLAILAAEPNTQTNWQKYNSFWDCVETSTYTDSDLCECANIWSVPSELCQTLDVKSDLFISILFDYFETEIELIDIIQANGLVMSEIELEAVIYAYKDVWEESPNEMNFYINDWISSFSGLIY